VLKKAGLFNITKNEFIKKNNIDDIFSHYSEVRNNGNQTLIRVI